MQLVSVIVPTHNRIHFLLPALESVLQQDYGTFEIIVVDDGSTDGTGSSIQDLSDSRIRYVYQTNAGRSIARNNGLRHASGDLVAFLDDDDVYLPDKLKRQVAFLDEHRDVDLVGGSATLVNSQCKAVGTWPGIHRETVLTFEEALYACPLMPSTVMARRTLFEQIDSWFDSNVEPVEDKEFFLRALARGYRAVVLPGVVSLYRIHTGNSQGDGARSTTQNLRCLEKIISLPGVPPHVTLQRNGLYGHYYLSGALHAYATGQVSYAQSSAERAVEHDPSLLSGKVPRFVERIAGFAHTNHVSDPIPYVDFVFENLPSRLGHLRRHRHAARSMFYWKRLYDSRLAGRSPLLADWLRAGVHDPRTLGNRGTWAILIREIIRPKSIKLLHNV